MSGRDGPAEVLWGSLAAVALRSLFVMHIASGVGPAYAKVHKNSLLAHQGLFSVLTGAMLLLKLAQFNWVWLILQTV